jgi:3-hydroxyisobutyrate dehydrogenase
MKIGFIGLGTMGAPMARNLLRAGFEVTVHNRTRDRELSLEALGASRAADPAGAAEGTDVVVTNVSDTPDVEHVLFGPRGVATSAREGCIVVDMSTISPDATRDFGARLAERGVRLVDAPVSGGSEGAEHGTLTVMVGGDEADVAAVRPLLDVLGSTVTHVGGLGAGQATKAVNQVIVGGMYAAVAEGVVLGMASGLDMEKVLEAISSGACRSWVLENRAGNMLRDEHPLGFRVALHRKDLGIALDSAARVGVELPVARLVRAMEDALVEAGEGDLDLSALSRAMRRRTGH